jgi:hypothetical protein
MSRYTLRGTASWDDCSDDTSSLGTDFRWEVGYDPAGLTFFAQLYDEAPMDDPEFPPTEHDLEQPIIWIGQVPYSVRTVADLEREMDLQLPDQLLADLRAEQERHLAGELDEPAVDVQHRLLTFQRIELQYYLAGVQRFIGHAT